MNPAEPRWEIARFIEWSHEGARGWVGELYLGDIGVPPQVYERFGFAVGGLFSKGDILFLR